jgi:TPR repeat protein
MSKKKTTTTGTSSTAGPSPSMRRQEEEPDVCCICLDELSTDDDKNARALCCGKQWHWHCQHKVQNSKMPDNLKYRCHQCRKPFPKTDEEQIEQLREWLDKGEAWAQIRMAHWYRDGKHGVKQSYIMARMLFEKAVAQGDPDAMFDFARLYEDGRGVVQSFQKAAELYTMAAEQGHVNAMYNLGLMYKTGQGVAQSFKKTFELYAMAVKKTF